MKRLQKSRLSFTAMVVLSICLICLFLGCGLASEGVAMAETPEPSSTPNVERVIIVTAASTAEPTATPEEPEAPTGTPEPTPEAEKVITYGDFRFVATSADAIPTGYIRVSEEYPFTLCAFIGEDGTTQWRIYAERDVYEDGELTALETGFLPCHVKSAVIRLEGDPSYKIEVAKDAAFIRYEDEQFGAATAYVYADGEANPYAGFVNVAYGTYDDTNPETMTAEPQYSLLYPAADGVSAPGAVPVDMDGDRTLWYTVPGGDKVWIETAQEAASEGETETPISSDATAGTNPPSDTNRPSQKPAATPKPTATPKPSDPGNETCMCGWCDAVFSSESALNAHIEQNHPACPYCGMRYLNQTNLNAHISREHSFTPAPTEAPTPKPTNTPAPTPSGHYERRWVVDKPAVTHDEWVCSCGHHSMSSSENNQHQKNHALNGESTWWQVITVTDSPEEGHWEEVWVPDP